MAAHRGHQMLLEDERLKHLCTTGTHTHSHAHTVASEVLALFQLVTDQVHALEASTPVSTRACVAVCVQVCMCVSLFFFFFFFSPHTWTHLIPVKPLWQNLLVEGYNSRKEADIKGRTEWTLRAHHPGCSLPDFSFTATNSRAWFVSAGHIIQGCRKEFVQ